MIEFAYIGVHGGMVTTACSECGATIVDWPKMSDTSPPRPNQDKHRAWHRDAKEQAIREAVLIIEDLRHGN